MKSENGEPGKQPFCFLRYDCYFFSVVVVFFSSLPNQMEIHFDTRAHGETIVNALPSAE